MIRFHFPIRFPSSIRFKLWLFVLPLVCLPVAITAYLFYKDSVERITRLKRDEQLLLVKAAATRINALFETCYRDMNTLSAFIHEAALPETGVEAVAPDASTRSTQGGVSRIFRDIVSGSPYYIRIRPADVPGAERTTAQRAGWKTRSPKAPEASLPVASMDATQRYRISRIEFSEPDNAYILRISTLPPHPGFPSRTGLVLDLDFSKLIELVTDIRTGKLGFAFLVDRSGRMIAHPLFDPYQYNLSKYDDPLLREVIVDMILGEAGWRTYRQIQRYAVAFAPIPATGWSIALSLPMAEFSKEAVAARRKMIETVIIILVVMGSAASLLLYRLYSPVKGLVAATEKIAGGDLRREIPVRSRDEFGNLAQHVNRVVRKLREIQAEIMRYEKLISMGKLSAGVAHEVRNPLNAMKGAIVYLQKSRSDDPLIQEYTQLILEEINKLDKFVTRFLYFSKPSSPHFVYNDLNGLIRETVHFLREEFRRKKIEVSLHLAPTIPKLKIDPHQIEQVYLNLFMNAVHAMPEGGVLAISSSHKTVDRDGEAERRVVTRIRDNGSGIREDDLSHIFELFFSTKKDGTGLGLPISQGIIEDHRGRLEVFSREGEGTTVIVELPLDKGKPQQEESRYEKEHFSR